MDGMSADWCHFYSMTLDSLGGSKIYSLDCPGSLVSSFVTVIFYLLNKLFVYQSLFISHINHCHLVSGTTTCSNLEEKKKDWERNLFVPLRIRHALPVAKTYLQDTIYCLFSTYTNILMVFFMPKEKKLEYLSKSNNVVTYPTRLVEHWSVPFCHNDYSMQSLNTLSHSLNTQIISNIDIMSIRTQDFRIFI